jgi:hypothetical protein
MTSYILQVITKVMEEATASIFKVGDNPEDCSPT